MSTAHDHLPARPGSQPTADRSPAVHDQGGQDGGMPTLRTKVADGRWQLYALEVLVLLVIFGWMAITNVAAGGHGPL